MARKKFDLSTLPDSPNLEHERALWQSGLTLIAGIDEAGRGALAGPVSAGAVILRPSDVTNRGRLGAGQTPDSSQWLEIRDSKQMTARARERAAELIRQTALAHAVGLASAAEIDQIGILPATRLAARRALEQLAVNVQPKAELLNQSSALIEHLLIDYITLPRVDLPQTPLIKGDRRSLSIAAAAILAKTTRDALLVELDAQYPQYGFARHKGYATAQHLAAIEEHGPCPEHRHTFSPIKPDPQLKLI